MDVVLAWGSMIAVSEPSHADLDWACKVRHIFGIVTCFKKKEKKRKRKDLQYSVPGMVCDIHMFYKRQAGSSFRTIEYRRCQWHSAKRDRDIQFIHSKP